MRLQDIDFSQVGFHPMNVVHEVSGEAHTQVLDELTALAAYAQLQALAAEIPPVLQDARDHLEATQKDYDDHAEEVERLATAMREARAAVELIPMENRAERAKAEEARTAAERKHGNEKAVLDQALRSRVRKATAKAENIAGLQAVIDGTPAPEAPLLAAALAYVR